MGYALVFSGQGAQHAAMLPWLRDDALVHRMTTLLGVADWRAAMADAGWAQRNAVAQPLLTALALSAWRQLAAELPPPAAVAGYSVGELAAFCAAGVFDEDTALGLSCQRAAAMDLAAAERPGGLLAVSDARDADIDGACRAHGVFIAIRNGPGAVVLGGEAAALALAQSRLAAQGARCQRLAVAVASHTPLMQAAAESFNAALAARPLAPPRLPLFANALDRVRHAPAARDALVRQIHSTVQWDDCMDNLHARRVDCVLEIGPGAALARLWNVRHADVPARSVDEFRSAAGVVAWVRSHAGSSEGPP
jgi:[acyl-carrier-protein] S-malonyltransferase